MTTILLDNEAALERLWTGALWGEGPVWLDASGTLRWSDIPNDRILDYSIETGRVTVATRPAEYSNGRTLDLAGAVIQCSHGRRAVERVVGDTTTTLVDRVGPHRLNSPNDVVVASDGAIWFTDPPYGIQPAGYEGHPGDEEYGGCHVFRFDETTGALSAVITDMDRPNGLAFSPDESLLYVSDTVEGSGAHLRVFDLVDGRPVDGRVFAVVRPGASDGFRVDVAGRIWTSAGDGVQVFDPSGELLLRIPVPETVANVAFGGPDGRDLYIAASTSLYRIRTRTVQAPRPEVPRRIR